MSLPEDNGTFVPPTERYAEVSQARWKAARDRKRAAIARRVRIHAERKNPVRPVAIEKKKPVKAASKKAADAETERVKVEEADRQGKAWVRQQIPMTRHMRDWSRWRKYNRGNQYAYRWMYQRPARNRHNAKNTEAKRPAEDSNQRTAK